MSAPPALVTDPPGADSLVPMVVSAVTFGAIVATVAILLFFRYRSQIARQELARAFLEKQLPVPAELLSASQRSRNGDLRRGMVLLLGGIGLSAALFFGGNRGAVGSGLVPALIGVAFLIVWRVEGRTRDDGPGGSSSHG
jgi:hypothetical protein